MVARRPAVGRALGRGCRRASARASAWSPGSDGARGRAGGRAIVVSAVPAAAWDRPEARAGLEAIDRERRPCWRWPTAPETPLARAVRGRATRYADGLGMLVHQAARAIELALGKEPPLPPLFESGVPLSTSAWRGGLG